MLSFLAAVTIALCAVLVPAQTVWPPVDGVGEQPPPPAPPREFRGAWVATVANIDWPSSRNLTVQQQQDEIRALVAAAKRLNLNALLFQVRPACDAMYASGLEPWSEFLTGESGKAPEPMYDPLQMWIEECHASGIELHTWFNPFRARHFEAKLPDAPNHVSNTKKAIVYDYDRFKWMDPGSSESQDWAIEVMRDVLTRYDIDGLHIDDYFYPYPTKDAFPDEATYQAYRNGGGTLAKNDWRRDCIDRFVKRMYEMVKAAKPYVKVGISPFGIWRPGFPKGIDGYDAFEKLHADARLWVNKGYLDYAAPQLYWQIGAPKQSFPKLLDWWIGESAAGRPVIPGLYTSRLDPAETKAANKWEPVEIVNQISTVRERQGAAGVIHFSLKALAKDYKGIGGLLASGVYAKPSLVPAFASCGVEAPAAMAGVKCEVDKEGRVTLLWEPPKECRVVVAAWKMGDEWMYEVVAAASGGVDRAGEGLERAAVAPVSRAGVMGEWRVFTGGR